jgi:hypothetical protein
MLSPEYRARLARTDPAYLKRLDEADALRAAFLAELGLRPIAWSAHNLSRMLNATGDTPDRVKVMRALLGNLGMGSSSWIGIGGAFDHGELLSRDRHPAVIVGHPYGINAEQREWLAALGRFSGLRVSVDDRPSYYQARTNHVRVELVEVRRRYIKPRSTYKTRSVAASFRGALRAEGYPR